MIRRYRAEDLEAVVDVWAEASAIAHHHLPVAETWVWDDNGRVSGFIALVGNEIGGLFVDPKLQGRGIGRALVDHARELRDEPLEVEVFKDNRIGRAFYDGYGFVEVEEHVHAETGFPVLRLELPKRLDRNK